MTHPPLADELVGLIMGKLALTYGRRFTGLYDASPDVVRRHWAHELAGVSKQGVVYALQHLPADYVPNCLQIRALAANRPMEGPPALPAPEVAPERLRRVLDRLQCLRGETGPGDPLAWARRVLADEGATRAAREIAQEALRCKGRA